jgi:hypothetical protein
MVVVDLISLTNLLLNLRCNSNNNLQWVEVLTCLEKLHLNPNNNNLLPIHLEDKLPIIHLVNNPLLQAVVVIFLVGHSSQQLHLQMTFMEIIQLHLMTCSEHSLQLRVHLKMICLHKLHKGFLQLLDSHRHQLIIHLKELQLVEICLDNNNSNNNNHLNNNLNNNHHLLEVSQEEICLEVLHSNSQLIIQECPLLQMVEDYLILEVCSLFKISYSATITSSST